MKEAKYMNAKELQEWLKLGVCAGELDAIAKNTREFAKTAKEKEWGKKVACAATYARNVLNERLERVEGEQLWSVKRRNDNTVMRMYTSDQIRLEESVNPANVPFEAVTVAINDLQVLAELAFCACQNCPQQGAVEKCEYRTVMHRIGMPVARMEVDKGQCEFRSDDEQKAFPPQKYEIIREEVI